MTVKKENLNQEPSHTFKENIIIAEHSPIRNIEFKWLWEDIPSWVATHYSRHKWECFITTQRTDRTGVDRNNLSQSALVSFKGKANAQHLIDTMRKRLCHCSADTTREYAEDLKDYIQEIAPELGIALVPNCIYRGGCPELNECGLYDRFIRTVLLFPEEPALDALTKIQTRYQMYDRFIKGLL